MKLKLKKEKLKKQQRRKRQTLKFCSRCVSLETIISVKTVFVVKLKQVDIKKSAPGV